MRWIICVISSALAIACGDGGPLSAESFCDTVAEQPCAEGATATSSSSAWAKSTCTGMLSDALDDAEKEGCSTEAQAYFDCILSNLSCPEGAMWEDAMEFASQQHCTTQRLASISCSASQQP